MPENHAKYIPKTTKHNEQASGENLMHNDVPNGGNGGGGIHGARTTLEILGGALVRHVFRDTKRSDATPGEARRDDEAAQKTKATRPHPSHAPLRKCGGGYEQNFIYHNLASSFFIRV